MSETTTENTEAVAESTGDSTEVSATEATTTEQKPTDGEAALGDAGKKALDAMKAERKAAREEAAAAKAERDALQAKLDGKEAEYKAEMQRREVEQAALSKANERIVSAELRAAAKGRISDEALSDLTLYIKPSDFEVGDDGSVNETEIATAITDLISKKPYLAVQDGKRFQGDADAGTRKEARPSQLTKSDLERMTPEQINEARKEGRLNDLMGVK